MKQSVDNIPHSEFRTPHSMTVAFAGGGTGGHLMPGLSVAEELLRRLPAGSRVTFVGTVNPLEKRMVEGRGFEFLTLPSLKRTGSILGLPRWAARAAGGLLAARRLIRRMRPDVVVSLGGYAAVAPSLAAALSGVTVAVMEQNALPGKTNRLLSRWAREVYAPWPGTEPFFACPERVRVTGNPVRAELLSNAECERRAVALPKVRNAEYSQRHSSFRNPQSAVRIRHAAAKFGLDPRKKTLLVMGGSQGAQSINRAVLAALPALEAESAWLQVLHSAGEGGYAEAATAYAGTKIQSAVLPFIEDMAAAYAACDLALCRAGGTTLAELTALGVPAVLVPLPSAANDHQRRNASFVAGAGAALILEQADMVEGRLAEILTGLLRNEECLARMRAASLRVGNPNATRNVVDRILALLHPNAECGVNQMRNAECGMRNLD